MIRSHKLVNDNFPSFQIFQTFELHFRFLKPSFVTVHFRIFCSFIQNEKFQQKMQFRKMKLLQITYFASRINFFI
jgi:hypothetical protein